MGLEEKIKYEFRCFYMSMIITSRENIFAHSREIETKKEIANELLRLTANLDEKTELLLLVESNLLESAYCFVEELQDPGAKEDIPGALKSWLEFLKSTERRTQGRKL